MGLILSNNSAAAAAETIGISTLRWCLSSLDDFDDDDDVSVLQQVGFYHQHILHRPHRDEIARVNQDPKIESTLTKWVPYILK